MLCARFKAGLGRSVVDRFPPLLASLTAAAAIDDFGAELFTTDLSLRVNHYFRWLMAGDEDQARSTPWVFRILYTSLITLTSLIIHVLTHLFTAGRWCSAP